MFAGISLTSCNENDNAIIINGKEWVKPEAIKTDDGAMIKANTLSDVSRLLMKVAKDINDAVQAGEDYVITIDAPALEASEDDHIINIPLYDYLSADPTNKAKVVVNFANSFSTDVPLLIQAKGATGGPVAAQNKVELNIPSGSSDINLELNMPATTVILNAEAGTVTINELVALTATKTLYIESGVTVNWLLLKSIYPYSYAVVKEGAKVLGFLGNSSNTLYVYDCGIGGRVYKDKLPESPTVDDYYYVLKGKVIKSEDGGYGIIDIADSYEETDIEVDITIADGAKANIDCTWSTCTPIVNITGEGNATIINDGYKDELGRVKLNSWGIGLPNINMLSNVTVDLSKALVMNDETNKYEELEVDEGEYSYIFLPINSENCTFKAKEMDVDFEAIHGNITSVTHKNCTFNTLGSKVKSLFEVSFPEQNDQRKSFTLSFDACEFDQATFSSEFCGYASEYEAFKAYISFDSSKIGGKAITKTTDMIYDVDDQYDKGTYTTSTFYTIDGTTYKPVKVDEKWVLEDVK
jgi:hypothetical protein